MAVPTLDLVNLCRSTSDAAINATAWLNSNKEQVRQEHASLLREFRKFTVAANKLTAAVERPMCVGVFGPSQSGKSYLISAFARPGTNPLIADFDGLPEGVDFVRHINPEGGSESTGLVTRFTMRRKPAPAGYPVAVRLLSQADVVKIIGNTFFSDCDLSDEVIPDAESIAKLVKSVSGAMQGAASPGLVEEDIWDIQDYFERQFKGEQIVRALSSAGYWTALADLAPRLPLASRAELFAPLWGHIEPLTELYLKLTGALDKLGHPAEAFCPIDALVETVGDGFGRRPDSVIAVHTLQGLGNTSAPTIDVRGAGHASASLARPVLTALIAELHVTMHERPWDFLESTDLLDFPGARSRDVIKDVRAYLKGNAVRKEPPKNDEPLEGLEGLFLRGKVAYLFERYNAEQELTSMLLCIGNSILEVPPLPGMVKDWIDITHGPDPVTRAGSETALFFVLTKFDLEFIRGLGDAADSTARWTRRLNVSLVEKFGKHGWPREWTPGHPFDNCFWLRNPNMLAQHILDYDEQGREIAVRPSEVNRIGQQRSEFLANEKVRMHFRDPAAAWDEAFRLNDGGVGYLARSIAPVCNPLIKLKQISTRLGTLRKTMRERLQRYYVTDDLEEQRAARNAAALAVAEQLRECAKHQRFGALIRFLQSSDVELGEVFLDVENRATDLEMIDRADAFAHAAVNHWLESIRLLADDAKTCGSFRFTETTMSGLVDELIAGSVRLEIRQRIALKIRRVLAPRARVRDSVVKPALLAADCIGSFVYWLGFDEVADGDRPKRKDQSDERIFQPVPTTGDLPLLKEHPSDFDHRFYGDWTDAFLEFSKLNSETIAGRQIDVEQNSRLGAILGVLGSETRVEALA